MSRGDTNGWVELDPDKADYGARWGARVGGQTLIELPELPTLVVIVGHMSCGSRESAEEFARRDAGVRGDRVISLKTFTSWRV